MFEVTGIPGRMDDKPLVRAAMNRSELTVYYGAYMVHEPSGTSLSKHSAEATNLAANTTCCSKAICLLCRCRHPVGPAKLHVTWYCVRTSLYASPASYLRPTAMSPSAPPVAGMILLPLRDRVLIQGISLEGILVGKSRLGPRCSSWFGHAVWHVAEQQQHSAKQYVVKHREHDILQVNPQK